MNSRKLVPLVLLFFCVTTLYAIGKKDKNDSPPQDEKKIVQVTGVVRLVGSAPSSEIIVAGAQGQWYIFKDDMAKLHNLQHQAVTVEGEETVIELTFASGIPAGTRRILRNIKIISIHQSLPES